MTWILDTRLQLTFPVGITACDELVTTMIFAGAMARTPIPHREIGRGLVDQAASSVAGS